VGKSGQSHGDPMARSSPERNRHTVFGMPRVPSVCTGGVWKDNVKKRKNSGGDKNTRVQSVGGPVHGKLRYTSESRGTPTGDNLSGKRNKGFTPMQGRRSRKFY